MIFEYHILFDYSLDFTLQFFNQYSSFPSRSFDVPIGEMTDLVEENSFETTPIKLLKGFYFLQQERVETYNLFEE